MVFPLLHLFCLLALPLRWISSSADTFVPSNFEVDLIFPRNNSVYKPVYPYPIVAAFQNTSALAWPYNLAFSWQWFVVGESAATNLSGSFGQGQMTATTWNSSSLYTYIDATDVLINTTYKNWVLVWNLIAPQECADPVNETNPWTAPNIGGGIYIALGASNGTLPNIVPADGSCPSPLYSTFIQSIDSYVVANQSSPDVGQTHQCLKANNSTPDPCPVKAASALAAEVTAAMEKFSSCGSWPGSEVGHCTGAASVFVPPRWMVALAFLAQLVAFL